MRPTEELMGEHKVILHVLMAAEKEAQNIRDKAAIRPELIGMMLDFFRNFADKCHHAKEEKHLFPMLEKRGMAHDSGPIAVMLAEHTEGRSRIANISALPPATKQNDPNAVRAVAENLEAYVNLLVNHIDKENNVLFPMAEKLLPRSDMDELEKAFARIEEIETGEGVHEKYHQLAHKISDSV